MIGGIVLASLGAVGMGIGTAVYVEAAASCSDNRGVSFVLSGCSRSDGKLVGMTVLLSSAATAAVGVPLWIYGAEKVVIPADEQPIREVSVRVGPASAALHVSF